MTIAAGFRCSDGVVVCADREHTTDMGKFKGDKILTRRLSTELRLIVTGAGTSDFIGITADSLEGFLKSKSAKLRQLSDLLGLIDEWGHEFYATHLLPAKAAQDQAAPSIASIVAVKLRGEVEDFLRTVAA